MYMNPLKDVKIFHKNIEKQFKSKAFYLNSTQKQCYEYYVNSVLHGLYFHIENQEEYF